MNAQEIESQRDFIVNLLINTIKQQDEITKSSNDESIIDKAEQEIEKFVGLLDRAVGYFADQLLILAGPPSPFFFKILNDALDEAYRTQNDEEINALQGMWKYAMQRQDRYDKLMSRRC